MTVRGLRYPLLDLLMDAMLMCCQQLLALEAQQSGQQQAASGAVVPLLRDSNVFHQGRQPQAQDADGVSASCVNSSGVAATATPATVTCKKNSTLSGKQRAKGIAAATAVAGAEAAECSQGGQQQQQQPWGLLPADIAALFPVDTLDLDQQELMQGSSEDELSDSIAGTDTGEQDPSSGMVVDTAQVATQGGQSHLVVLYGLGVL